MIKKIAFGANDYFFVDKKRLKNRRYLLELRARAYIRTLDPGRIKYAHRIPRKRVGRSFLVVSKHAPSYVTFRIGTSVKRPEQTSSSSNTASIVHVRQNGKTRKSITAR